MRVNMSQLTSVTIREDDIPTYKRMREYLTNTKQSVGRFLIDSYISLEASSTLDDVNRGGSIRE
jgi:hypothetical protein